MGAKLAQFHADLALDGQNPGEHHVGQHHLGGETQVQVRTLLTHGLASLQQHQPVAARGYGHRLGQGGGEPAPPITCGGPGG